LEDIIMDIGIEYNSSIFGFLQQFDVYNTIKTFYVTINYFLY